MSTTPIYTRLRDMPEPLRESIRLFVQQQFLAGEVQNTRLSSRHLAEVVNSQFSTTEGMVRLHSEVVRDILRGLSSRGGLLEGIEEEKQPKNPYASLPDRTAEEAQLRELFSRWENRQAMLPIVDAEEGERAIYLTDLQVPFQDKPLLEAVEQFMLDFQPDRIFYMGDSVDLYTISTFDKNPTRRFHLEDETKETRGVYDRHHLLVPDAEQYHIDGNHEFRLIRELMRAGGEFYGLMDEDDGDPVISIPKILGLRKRNIHYVAWPGRIDYCGFVITHGPPPRRMSFNVKHCAKMMSEIVRSSGICGDFHRKQSYSWVGDEGQPQAWICQGCLCRLDPDYAPFPDWQQSITYSVVLNGKVHPTEVVVFDRRFYAEGKEYRY